MDFLKQLSSLARADERCMDLSMCCADCRSVDSLLRHAPGVRPVPLAKLLFSAPVPEFLSEQPFQRVIGDFLLAGGQQQLHVLNIRTNAVISISAEGNFVDAAATEEISGFSGSGGGSNSGFYSSVPDQTSESLDDDIVGGSHNLERPGRILVLLDTSYILLKESKSPGASFSAEINFKQIDFARAEPGDARLRVESRGKILGTGTACCAVGGAFYVATSKGIYQLQNGVLKQNKLSQLRELLENPDIIELVSDNSRSVFFSLSGDGKICAYQKSGKQIKTAVQHSAVVRIAPVSALESKTICLCGVEAGGNLVYFQLSEQHQQELLLYEQQDEAELDCLKIYFQKASVPGLRRFLGIKRAPGVTIRYTDNEILLEIIDQSKKQGVEYSYNLSLSQDDQEVKDCAFSEAPASPNALSTQFQGGGAEFLVLTNGQIQQYAVLRPYEVFKEMLLQQEGEEHYFACFNLFRQLYTEQEALSMLLYLKTCETDADWREAEFLARVRHEQLQQELPIRCRPADVLLEKYQSQEFEAAVALLVERVSWQMLSFQFLYAPESKVSSISAVEGKFIPFPVTKAKNRAQTYNVPFVPFSHARIFEIAVRLHNIQIFIEQAQDYTQKQFVSAAEELEYLKEILFFLALALQPENLPRVLPELLSTEGGVCEPLPRLLGGCGPRYLVCPSHSVKFYLDYNNRNSLEALVRRLNLVVQAGNVRSTTTVGERSSFEQDFNALCKVLSQVFSKRLTALQLLETAASANTVVRRENVDEAYRILEGKYSMLTPITPIRVLFAKCESLETLMKLILNAKNDHIRAFGIAMEENTLYQEAVKQTIDGNTNAGVALFNNVKSEKYELKGWMTTDSEEETDPVVIAPYIIRTSMDSLMEAVKATAAELPPVTTVAFSLQPGEQIAQLNEEQCQELFQAMQEALDLIENEYLFQGLDQRISRFEAEARPTGQLFSKGIRIVQAAVIACKDEFWHYELYRFLYAHYYMNSVVLEASSPEDREALNLQLHAEVCDRAREALLSIVSPYISEFLKETDGLLHLRYLEKNQKLPEFCNTAYEIASEYGRQCMSPLPNSCVNGVWERQSLNFAQLSSILHSTYAKLSGGHFGQETEKSLYQTETQPRGLAETTDSDFQSAQLPQQSLLQLEQFFRTHIHLSDIEHEFFDRAGSGKDADALEKRLLTVAELDQMLKQNKSYDLSLVLQYNIINKSQAEQFLIPAWKGLFGVSNDLQSDVQQMRAVLLRTDLQTDDLQLPVQLLLEKHSQSSNFEDFIKIFTKTLFSQYYMINRVIQAVLQLALNQRLTQRQQEASGLLCLHLLGHRQQIPTRPDDPEISPAVVRRELSKAPRAYASWQRAAK